MVRTGSACQIIVAQAANQRIRPLVADKTIISGLASRHIVAVIPDERIVSGRWPEGQLPDILNRPESTVGKLDLVNLGMADLIRGKMILTVILSERF